MDCRRAEDLLLRSDDPRGEAARRPELAEHLGRCAACAGLVDDVVHLEQAWREMPLPAAADESRAAFLERLARPAAVEPVRAVRLRRVVPRRWAVAALVLLTLGMGSWLLLPTPEAHAAPDVVERLLDWNLELSEAATPAERNRIYVHQAPRLRDAVRRASLPAGEGRIAATLLENGSWLAEHDDPVDEAERFSDLADALLDQLEDAATEGKEYLGVDRLARLYGQVAEHGIAANLEKEERAGSADARRHRRLAAVAQRHARRLEKLQALRARVPASAREELRRAEEVSARKHKHGKRKAHAVGNDRD